MQQKKMAVRINKLITVPSFLQTNTENLCNFIWAYNMDVHYRAKARATTTMTIMGSKQRKNAKPQETKETTDHFLIKPVLYSNLAALGRNPNPSLTLTF